MMFLQFLILIAGFVFLIKGADFFVDGSAALARMFKVSPLVIGLTIVALGTSLPELAVSTSAAVQGANEIALSNVVGSNLFNLLGVLGICAIIHSVPVETEILRRDFPFSIFITLVMLFGSVSPALLSGSFARSPMLSEAGMVSRILGLALLTLFVLYLVYIVYDAKKKPQPDDGAEPMPLWRCLLLIVLGVGLIIAGGQCVVQSAKKIALAFGMTETLVGLTIVALGTSLPELVTSIVAAHKGETELAVGNVVGSNIFNILFILGVSSSIHPVSVNAASVYDMLILVAVSLFCWLFCATGKRVSRIEGILMVLMYAAAMTFAVLR